MSKSHRGFFCLGCFCKDSFILFYMQIKKAPAHIVLHQDHSFRDFCFAIERPLGVVALQIGPCRDARPCVSTIQIQWPYFSFFLAVGVNIGRLFFLLFLLFTDKWKSTSRQLTQYF